MIPPQPDKPLPLLAPSEKPLPFLDRELWKYLTAKRKKLKKKQLKIKKKMLTNKNIFSKFSHLTF
jgi:hypothetical protein